MNKKNIILHSGKNILRLAATNINNIERLLGDTFIEAVNILLSTKGNIVISGIGKSGIIAKKIAATLSSMGTFSYYIHPIEALHGDLGLTTSRHFNTFFK